MRRRDFYENIEGIMEIKPGTLKGDEELVSLGDWNSLSILSFIAFADGMLGLSLNPEQLKKAKTVPDLLATVASKIDDYTEN